MILQMLYSNLTVEELQRCGTNGDEAAILELGRRALNIEFCDGTWEDSSKFCDHAFELKELQEALETEIPPDCPHCGGWLTNV